MAEKKEVKRKLTSQKWKLYENGKPKNKFCPKCGPGVFLAQHKDRLVCGNCHYMEKISGEKKEDKAEPKDPKPKDKEAKQE